MVFGLLPAIFERRAEHAALSIKEPQNVPGIGSELDFYSQKSVVNHIFRHRTTSVDAVQASGTVQINAGLSGFAQAANLPIDKKLTLPE